MRKDKMLGGRGGGLREARKQPTIECKTFLTIAKTQGFKPGKLCKYFIAFGEF